MHFPKINNVLKINVYHIICMECFFFKVILFEKKHLLTDNPLVNVQQ